MAKEEQSSLITSLPQDVIVDILARVSRFDYPALSLVCKHFRSIVTSPEIFTRRSLLGCTEHCLYVVLVNENEPVLSKRLCILCLKDNGVRSLVRIRSLPDMPTYISYISMEYVAMGSRIYVFGWGGKHHMITLSIDCVTHIVQHLPSVHVLMSPRMADIIDGRIYVIGYDNDWKMVMVVFNTETQMWEPETISINKEINMCTNGCVAMADKLYTRNHVNSFVYDPKKSKWQKDKVLNRHTWTNACVVDDVLYYFDDKFNAVTFHAVTCCGSLRAYHGKKRRWQVVKGLEAILPKTRSSAPAHVVNHGGKLALFFHKRNEIWCAEISLETRQGGKIWGKTEWYERLLTGKFLFMKALSVVV
ncbi:F-box/kelch-repeat protein [Raphanus sativus]|uniref:F-box/kelch-repeat protein At4g38940-like n=1 Tax=Raphanus sativus TaxID=3726 RepID=A0A6J0MU74_RAPSA|nr:F-box/kelch-repeat protein At4g38940-like [Raphanus sativus]KAJ4907399.1 F-box/kelch-repeat protein [Raphanus sativus]